MTDSIVSVSPLIWCKNGFDFLRGSFRAGSSSILPDGLPTTADFRDYACNLWSHCARVTHKSHIFMVITNLYSKFAPCHKSAIMLFFFSSREEKVMETRASCTLSFHLPLRDTYSLALSCRNAVAAQLIGGCLIMERFTTLSNWCRMCTDFRQTRHLSNNSISEKPSSEALCAFTLHSQAESNISTILIMENLLCRNFAITQNYCVYLITERIF